MTTMFPIFLKLEGRRVLVVGAGSVAEGKIRGLLEARAAVSVVAPQATEQVRYWAAAGVLSWRVAEFESSDLEDTHAGGARDCCPGARGPLRTTSSNTSIALLATLSI